MLDKIKQYFSALTPKQKKIVAGGGLVAAIVAFSLAGYMTRSTHEETFAAKPNQKQKVMLDANLIEKTYSENIRKDLNAREAEITELKGMLGQLQLQMDAQQKTSQEMFKMQQMGAQKNAGGARKLSTDEEGAIKTPEGQKTAFPPEPPPLPQGKMGYPPSPGGEGSAGYKAAGMGLPQEPLQSVGGIELLTVAKQNLQPAVKNEKKRSVYLPPSFMEATLLTGFSAATMQGAKTYEKPLLLRIKNLAVLPNDIKSDLKGCFVVASAYGDLSDERAHARLVGLSCISSGGHSVIDAKVKGFVVDGDGKIGLAGNVITRAGALLGRSVVAGFFGGVGEAVKAQTVTSAISPLGTTQAIDAEQILTAGVGSGVSGGFKKLQDFYLDMAKQTFPVIEVGAEKTVTVVIEEGVSLEIEEQTCVGGIDKCE